VGTFLHQSTANFNIKISNWGISKYDMTVSKLLLISVLLEAVVDLKKKAKRPQELLAWMVVGCNLFINRSKLDHK
jgi:hypothetical protein